MAMLIGNNVLRLNGATMSKIVQEWVDREMKSPVKVASVVWDGQTGFFNVATTDKPTEEKAD